ncbi:MAG: Ku protein [Gemmatimonadetes bacterium]|nr:Ku protein [Gemmatimonadota bacterium]
MAPRPSWKGFLRLSLVNIPVRLYPATSSSATVSFNQLHKACGTRINMKRWCPHCDVEVEWGDVTKGYEFAKNRWVVMEDPDFDNVRLETSDAIRLMEFVEAAELPALYVERAHYLAPDGRVAGEAYGVLREAMEGKVGIGKLVMNGRERIVAVQPWERAMIVYTLYYADEVRGIEEVPGLEAKAPESTKAELQLARQLIDSVTTSFDLRAYQDEYHSALMKVIEQKVAGQETTPTYTAEAPQVIDLMEALKASLDKAGKAKKKPARAELQPVAAAQVDEEMPRARRAAGGAKSPATRKRARTR